MAGRKVGSEQEARRCLAAARAAGERAGDWARTHGIDGRSLNAWRVNLERRGTPRPRAAPRLVELVPTTTRSATVARYVLHVGGVELELGDDFHEDTVRRLVQVLLSC
jgi:transposase-like protein